MRKTVVLFALLTGATLSAASFNWENIPHTVIEDGTTFHSGYASIAFYGDGWVQYDLVGKVGYQPTEYGTESRMVITWVAPVDASITLEGLVANHFRTEVMPEFSLGGESVAYDIEDPYRATQEGGWIYNPSQWTADGRFTVVPTGAVDTAEFTFTTKDVTGAGSLYWVTFTLRDISYEVSQIPETSHLTVFAGLLCMGMVILVNAKKRS